MTTRPLTVVKCGGNPSVDAASICADVAGLVREGQSVLLVHGGSGEIARLAGKLGVPQRTLVAPDKVSTRYTDPATLEVVILALAGGVKPRIVAELSRLGVPSVGLTGLDGGMLRARRKSAVRSVVDGRTVLVRDNLSGRLTEVRTELAETLLRSGFVPVVSPPAVDEHDQPVNVDADRVAAALAVALGADRLVLLTGAPGVLADPDDDTSVLDTCEVPATGAPGRFAAGGMALKLVAAREALAGGVASVRIADGRVAEPVSRALAGSGTAVTMTGAGSATSSLRERGEPNMTEPTGEPAVWQGGTVWLTGLPSAGKTTIAVGLAERLRAEGHRVQVLDGDEVRAALSAELGFSKEDRDTNVRRVGYVAGLLAAQGVTVLVPVIAPYALSRAAVREQHAALGVPYIEVHVATPVETCAGRDVKGLYAKQAAGDLRGLTGVDDPYEAPVDADLSIHTDNQTVDGSVQQLRALLTARGLS